MAFHVGRHPWSVPWPLFDRLDGLRGAVGYRPGLTIDIHAYAYRALPPANLVSCRIQLELCRYRTQIPILADRQGRPLCLRVSGQRHDRPQARILGEA